jgi:hypothetical protein
VDGETVVKALKQGANSRKPVGTQFLHHKDLTPSQRAPNAVPHDYAILCHTWQPARY